MENDILKQAFSVSIAGKKIRGDDGFVHIDSTILNDCSVTYMTLLDEYTFSSSIQLALEHEIRDNVSSHILLLQNGKHCRILTYSHEEAMKFLSDTF